VVPPDPHDLRFLRPEFEIYLYRFLMRSLLRQLLLLLLLLVVWNVCLSRLTQATPAKALYRKLGNTHQATHVFLGNSLMASGIDEAVFRSSVPPSVISMNIALGWSRTVEHRLILKRMLEKNSPRVLVYGFFDFQITEPNAGTWRDILGNSSISFYIDSAEAARLYESGSVLAPVQWRLVSKIPMVTERVSWWGKVDAWRRRAEEWGMPKQKVNQFGRVNDFQSLQSASQADFIQKCKLNLNLGFNEAIKAMMQSAADKGMKVVLVEMPISPQHQKLFYQTDEWREYRAHLKQLASARSGISYLEASDWINDPSLFADVIHLSPAGAVEFSKRLAGVLPR